MRKIILIFGLLSGTGLTLFLLISMALWNSGTLNFDNGELFGYGGMVIALSLVFFGIKSYRDNYLSGAIRFVKALQVGLLITLIASFMYAATWEVYAQVRPDGVASFMDQYTEHVINKERQNGATPDEIDQKLEEMNDFNEMYKNPLVRFGMTLLEVLPVGILVTLISAAILRRKELLPPTAVVQP